MAPAQKNKIYFFLERSLRQKQMREKNYAVSRLKFERFNTKKQLTKHCFESSLYLRQERDQIIFVIDAKKSQSNLPVGSKSEEFGEGTVFRFDVF